jgi:hypothetical protein
MKNHLRVRAAAPRMAYHFSVKPIPFMCDFWHTDA